MPDDDRHDSPDRLSALLPFLGRISTLIGALVENRAAQALAFGRREVKRVASMFALALCAAFFACAAAGFAAVAILAAIGEAHRVLGAACVAAGFALLAALAVLMLRNAAAGK
jgi:FtsH-binding integral membrane protein